MTGRGIAQTVVLVIAWVFIIWIVITMLTGCLAIQEREAQEAGNWRIEADCDENTLDVEFSLDDSERHREAEAKKP